MPIGSLLAPLFDLDLDEESPGNSWTILLTGIRLTESAQRSDEQSACQHWV